MNNNNASQPPRLPGDLGAIRTVMAADRTLMAWVRTGMSMLTFSFAIYKVLVALATQSQTQGYFAPEQVGLFLAGMGTLSLILGTLEYIQTLRVLNTIERVGIGRPALLIALLMSVVGVALLVTIAFRVV